MLNSEERNRIALLQHARGRIRAVLLTILGGMAVAALAGFAWLLDRRVGRPAQRASELAALAAQAEAIAGFGFWDRWPDGSTYWSIGMDGLFGLDRSDRPPLHRALACIRPRDRRALLRALLRQRSGDGVQRLLVRLGDAAPGRRTLEVIFQTRDLGPGRGVVRSGVVVDVSLLIEQGEALSAMNAELEERVRRRTVELEAARDEAQRLARVKSSFLANMSHEIRTPLNAVLGFAQIGLRDSIGLPAQAQFGRIVNAGDHLLRVINDVLDLSRIESGKVVVESRAFALRAVLADVSSIVIARRAVMPRAWRTTARSPTTLRTGCGADGAAAATGPGQLAVERRQVHRAWACASGCHGRTRWPQHGSLRGRRHRHRHRRRPTGTAVRALRTGRQLDHPRPRRRRPWTGDLQPTRGPHGRLDCGDRHAGVGQLLHCACRCRHVPRRSCRHGRRPSVAGCWAFACSRPRTTRSIASCWRSCCVTKDADVVFAEDGQQAVQRLDERGEAALDAVLMDVQMPVLDGYEATRRIRAAHPELPVIGLTAHALPDARQLCLEAGMVEHVVKPIDMAELVAAIRRHVRDSDRRAAAEAPSDAPAQTSLSSCPP